jgi:hypothetical protein
MAPSARRGCRHYVAGALHRVLPENAYVVRPSRDGSFDFVVGVQECRIAANKATDGPVGTREVWSCRRWSMVNGCGD